MIQKRIKKGNSLIDFPSDYIVFDIETTGLDQSINEIIEIGAVKVVNNEVTDTYNSLIKPNEKISSFITNLTHITNEMVEHERSADVVLKEFKEFIKDSILVGHNVNFDINFTYDLLLRNDLEPLDNDFIDTLRLARLLLTNLRNHTLNDLTEYYEINNDSHHRALADCIMTNEVFNNLKSEAIKHYDSVDNFKNKYSKSKNNYVKSSDILPTTKEFDINHPLYNKVIVITGEFSIIRENLMQILVNYGAKLSDYVTNKTNILLTGINKTSKKSSKLTKTEELNKMGENIKIMNEEELLNIITVK